MDDRNSSLRHHELSVQAFDETDRSFLAAIITIRSKRLLPDIVEVVERRTLQYQGNVAASRTPDYDAKSGLSSGPRLLLTSQFYPESHAVHSALPSMAWVEWVFIFA